MSHVIIHNQFILTLKYRDVYCITYDTVLWGILSIGLPITAPTIIAVYRVAIYLVIHYMGTTRVHEKKIYNTDINRQRRRQRENPKLVSARICITLQGSTFMSIYSYDDVCGKIQLHKTNSTCELDVDTSAKSRPSSLSSPFTVFPTARCPPFSRFV